MTVVNSRRRSPVLEEFDPEQHSERQLVSPCSAPAPEVIKLAPVIRVSRSFPGVHDHQRRILAAHSLLHPSSSSRLGSGSTTTST
jgi:hypothetical protein